MGGLWPDPPLADPVGSPEGERAAGLVRELSRVGHIVPVRGADVDVLSTPTEFFEALLAGIRSARRDISIASLYIGAGGGREGAFLDALGDAAGDEGRPDLRVSVVLDAARGLRPVLGGGGGERYAGGDRQTGLWTDERGSSETEGRRGDSSTAGPSAPPHPPSSPGPTNSPAASTTSSAQEVAARLFRSPARGDAPRPARHRLHLFRSPAHRPGLWLLLPPRVREVVGVQHIKAFVFDDDVILTGANVSASYLESRQDRYLIFRSAPELAAAVRQVLGVVRDFSLEVAPLEAGGSARGVAGREVGGSGAGEADGNGGGAREGRRGGESWDGSRGTVALPGLQVLPPPCGIDPGLHPWMFRRAFRDRILEVTAPPSAAASLAGDEDPSERRDERGLLGDRDLLDVEDVGEPPIPPAAPASSSGAPPLAPPGGATTGSARPPTQTSARADTWVVPAVQAGFAGVRQEESAEATWLGEAGAAGGDLALATPYLNLAGPLERSLARAHALSLTLITCAPESNGFFGSQGVSGYIPLAYSLIERSTWERILRPQEPTSRREAGRGGAARARLPFSSPSRGRLLGPAGPRALPARAPPPSLPGHVGSRTLLEYYRPGWGYHAKGAWWWPSGDRHPLLTSLGSSNFGIRSTRRDLELQFTLVTTNRDLRGKLHDEARRIAAYSRPVTAENLSSPQRNAGPALRALVRALRSFL